MSNLPTQQQLQLPGAVTRTSLELPHDMSLEDWIATGQMLDQMEGAVQWWRGDWWAYGTSRQWGEGHAIAAQADVDYGTIRTYGSVARAYELSMRIDNLTFAHHQVAMAAEPEDRAEWLAKAVDEEWSVAKLRNAIKQAADRQTYEASIESGCTVRNLEDLISAGKKFGVIYADPPWSFKVYSGKGKARSADRHYDTMDLEAIKALPIAQLAADDCALFLWGVCPEVPGALDVIRAWGFEFKTKAFTWIKQNPSGDGLHWGMGYWTRANSEDVWFGTRGAPRRKAMDVHQVILSPVGKHSRKPEEAYERIERLLNGPYLELFGRRKRRNWTVWGNEIEDELFSLDIQEFVSNDQQELVI